MKDGVRQSNSWLHGWAGLLLGWLMFAIFVTGTIAFFRQEVTVWMQPEVHRAQRTTPVEAAKVGLAKLEAIAPDARAWTVNLPSERNPTLRVSWDSGERRGSEEGGRRPRAERGAREMAAVVKSPERIEAEEAARLANEGRGRKRPPSLTLDPARGDVLKPRETAGGEFLYRFHYQLHAVPRDLGRWIVGLTTLAMFIAILTGIITHKKIFKDFFTFRRNKGQRSWLDAHNAVAVTSLPFHLMITFSGLLLLGGTLLPWGSQAMPGNGARDEHREERSHADAAQEERPKAARLMQPIGALLGESERIWGQPAGRFTIERPRGVPREIELAIQRNDSLLLRAGGGPGRTLKFDASGKLLEAESSLPKNAIEGTDRVLAGLHLARFAPWELRWVFFAAGVLGTIMVGTGLILWSVKRAEKRRGAPATFGHRLVDQLNIGAITGLMVAVGAYFWANRLLPAEWASRSDREIAVFFSVWLLAFLHPLFRSSRRAWIEQLCVGGTLFVTLPVLNVLTGGAGLPAAVVSGNWIVVGFDMISLLAGAALLIAARRLANRQTTGSVIRRRAELPSQLLPAE